MKTIKKIKKVVWGIEHRKNCLLKDELSIVGYHLFETKRQAELYAPENSVAVKVLITIERPSVYG
jgi:hypothetical protein